MRYWTYLNANEIDLINWDWVYEEKDTVRWDASNEHFLVSFKETYFKTFQRFNGITPMNQNEALMLMNNSNWYVESDE